MQNKTELRKAVGRGKFTSVDLAAAADISRPVARRRLAALAEAGIVERLDEVAKVTDEQGEAQRGRPRQVFRVAKGK
jgi:predicted ArsR family transcriptional regulator